MARQSNVGGISRRPPPVDRLLFSTGDCRLKPSASSASASSADKGRRGLSTDGSRGSSRRGLSLPAVVRASAQFRDARTTAPARPSEER